MLAVAVIGYVAILTATQALHEGTSRQFKLALFGLSVIACLGLAQFAVTQHDVHLDLTHNHAFTANKMAVELVASLNQPVSVTYFGHDDDPKAKRLKVILESLERSSQWLTAAFADPDKDPLLARRYDVKFYNIAVIEAAGRRVLASTTSEIDIAIAIQKALRQKELSACFVTGHGELGINNEEFHTHIESFGAANQQSDHQHGHAHIPVVQTTQHGAGRLRRSLEALGFLVSELNLTTVKANSISCDVVAIVGPQHPYSPDEIGVIRKLYESGTSVITLLDLGNKAPLLSAFLSEQGISLENTVVIDDKQHHEQDVESLAVSSYPNHVITERIAMTIFPGARSLKIDESNAELAAVVNGSVYSRKMILGVDSHQHPHAHEDGTNSEPLKSHSPNDHDIRDGVQDFKEVAVGGDKKEAPPVIIAVKESSGGKGKLVVAGDADFLTNSYFPYLSNSSLALSIFRWALGEQDAIRTEPTLPVFQTVVLTQPQMRLLFALLVIGLPCAVLLVGFIIWLRNR